ncbi:MAG: hypothetical protein CMH50_00340, partial [Myxococcales bacterium]|nr:hypothetical protein [Myxococcales bacterium]
QVNPEDLSDLRSIAQVVSFLVADLGDEVQPSVVVEASAPAVDDGLPETVVTGSLACRAVQPRLIQGSDPSDVPAFHCLPDHEIWIYDNGTSFAQALVSAFEARGVAARVIDDKGEGNCKPCGGLVLLAGSNESNHPLWSAATEEQLKRSVMLVKNLAPALRSAQAAGGALLCSVTQLDGRLGTGQTDHLVDPLQAGLAGLVKTAAKEWSGLHGRVIDVAPQWGDTTSAEAVVDACLKSGPVELGLGPDGEVTLDVLTQPEPRPRRALEAGSLFIITGGARGVTAACAIELASRQPGLAFALWGRSRLEPEPEDLEGVEDEASLKRLLLERSGAVQTPKELQAACARILAQREIRATLAAIEAVGAKAVYASVDLRDKDAVSTEVTQLEARFGPVRGIVHGAGVLRDRRIEDKTRDQLDDVLDTKLAGLRHLLGTLRLEELRSLNLFASITGRVGRVGQVDYAVANQALDKVAWQLAAQLPACRVQSFAWGPWDGGMVTPALRQTFVNEGVGLIPLQAGARCFADWALAAPGAYAELLVGVDLPELAAADALGGKDGRALRHVDLHPELPVLTHHRLAGEGVLPMALGVDWMVQESRRLGLGLQLNRVENAQVLQGVSVSEPLTLSVCLESSRVEGNDLRQTMSLRDSSGRQRMRAEVVLSSEAPRLQSTSMDALPASGGYSSEAIYGEALFHGPLLQAIESVDGLNSDGIDVSLVRPEAAGPWLQDEGADWDPEGALWLDSAFQAMILWSRDQQSAPSLPSRFGRWQRFQDWPEVAPRLRARVRSVKGAMITSDICFLGPDDEVVALVEDYAATASPQLADAFEDHGNEPAPKG